MTYSDGDIARVVQQNYAAEFSSLTFADVEENMPHQIANAEVEAGEAIQGGVDVPLEGGVVAVGEGLLEQAANLELEARSRKKYTRRRTPEAQRQNEVLKHPMLPASPE